MQTLQIRLPEEQIQSIDLQIKRGVFRSRSDAIRNALGRLRVLVLMDSFRNVIEKEGVSKENLLKELGAIRGELYKKYL